MKKLLIIVSIAILSIAISGCMGSARMGVESKEIHMLLKKAEAKRKMASKEGVEFRFTKKYIKQGHEALKKGDMKKAKALAKKALIQASRALEQKQISKENWMLAVPK